MHSEHDDEVAGFSVATTSMNLKEIMLNEKGQSPKNAYYIISCR